MKTIKEMYFSKNSKHLTSTNKKNLKWLVGKYRIVRSGGTLFLVIMFPFSDRMTTKEELIEFLNKEKNILEKS